MFTDVHGAEPNADDGHPKPGSSTPSDDTTAGAPTLADVEAGSVAGTGCAADVVALNEVALVSDGSDVGVGMAGEALGGSVET